MEIHQPVQIEDEAQTISLLVMATASDVREAVRYMKRKPEGLTSIEAMDPVRKKVFDPRRVAAYELWGIIFRTSDRLKLTPLGWDLARSLAPEAQIFRVMIKNTPPYHAALDWFFQSKLQRVTATDVLAYWQEHDAHFLDQRDEKTLEAGVITFFQLCHAADLGMATRGRKGQPTRLHIHSDELSAYLAEEKPAAIKAAPKGDEQKSMDARVERRPRLVMSAATQTPFRVLISHNLRANIAGHLQEMMELMGIESEVIQRRAGDMIPLAEDMLQALRRCAAAIIIIADEDCDVDRENRLAINKTGIVEIGAAFLHFDRRVHLLWDKKIPVPANLKRLPFCEIEGDELTSWGLGFQLIKSVKDFEEHFQREVLKRFKE